MIRFSLGYNHEPEFFTTSDEFGHAIAEVYLPLPTDFSGSARQVKAPFREEQFFRVLQEVHARGYSANIVANAPNTLKEDARWFGRLLNYIEAATRDGKCYVTVVDLRLADILAKESRASLEISVNLRINHVHQAMLLCERIPFSGICWDRSVNRQWQRTLANTKALKVRLGKEFRVKMLTNEGCIPECPFKSCHDNLVPHDPERKYSPFYTNSCFSAFRKHTDLFLKTPVIFPSQMYHMQDDVDLFKLSTRTRNCHYIRSVLSFLLGQRDLSLVYYVSGFGSPDDHPLVSELSEEYFHTTLNCNLNCDECKRCDTFAHLYDWSFAKNGLPGGTDCSV